MATESWITRIWREHRAGNLTRARRDVLLTLHTYRAAGGAAWPAHATLADPCPLLRAHRAGRSTGRR